MRTRFLQLFLAAITLCAPASARAQDGAVIPREVIGPLSHPRYEDGGFYTGLEFLYMTQKHTIGSQNVAFRGFVDIDGSISGTPNTFVGSGTVALNTGQLDRQDTSPGFNLFFGYRFQNGVAVEARWWHLADLRSSASTSVIAPGYKNGNFLEDTVFFSPVVNLPPQFAGNLRNLNVGNLGATYGIWNAYSIAQISWTQRFDMVDLMGRIPIMETDNYRNYGLFGPRGIVMWERFKWRTVDVGAASLLQAAANANGNLQNFITNIGIGDAAPNTIADYNNTVSNRLYGLVLGCGNEYRLGDTPIGTFSAFLDVNAALYGDFVKGRARYELSDKSIAYTYGQNMFTLAPGFDARIGFNWYIYEAISIRLGYNYLGVWNTVASPTPIDFNLGGAHPSFQANQFRYVQGLDFGICFVW